MISIAKFTSAIHANDPWQSKPSFLSGIGYQAQTYLNSPSSAEVQDEPETIAPEPIQQILQVRKESMHSHHTTQVHSMLRTHPLQEVSEDVSGILTCSHRKNKQDASSSSNQGQPGRKGQRAKGNERRSTGGHTRLP